MRRPQGYATLTCNDTGQLLEEQDTFSCGHCNAIVPVEPGQVDTDSCRACDSHICLVCVGELTRTLRCIPFEKRMDHLERLDRRLRAVG